LKTLVGPAGLEPATRPLWAGPQQFYAFGWNDHSIGLR
jgi:hypothetical protein